MESKQKPQKPQQPLSATEDIRSIILLVLLYLLQGVPLGLTFGAIPFLLKSKLNYADLALFSLSSYPYSLKLLWSPIVDSLYSKSFGRRKSWIVPIQFILGLCLTFVGGKIDQILESEEIPIKLIAAVFTLMVFLCATQDIAVDGWALSLLEEDNKTYASTAQTIGLNSGYFLSFTVFLAFNSPEFCNKYIRSTPADQGLLTLGSYLQFWGWMFLICTVALVLLKKENPDEKTDSVGEVYETIWTISKMKHVQKFYVVLMIAKIGFQANEAATGLKLLEKGFNKEYLALSVLIDFPLQLVFGYYAAMWSSGDRPLKPWIYGFYGRLAASMVGMFVVWNFPTDGVTTSYFVLIMVATILSSFMNTIQFVGMGSFFTKISDPVIGGTYMTLLNTLSNLGGTWPRSVVLLAIDYFTVAPCSATLEGQPLKCGNEKNDEMCKSLGGTCSYISDGYYAVNIACFIFGLLSLQFYIKPTIKQLERLPKSAWRVETKSKQK